MAGVLMGIARHGRVRGQMETLDRVAVSVERGIEGDVRGIVAPAGLGRRQVTLMANSGWQSALHEIGRDIAWQERRANLLIEGIEIADRAGGRLRIGDVLLLLTIECDPCRRMDAVAPGLQAALRKNWRGGVCARVERGGGIAVGDAIEWEPS